MPDTAEKGFAEGMEMIFKQLKDVFEELQMLRKSKLWDDDFDPNFHNAVMTEDTDRI